MSKKYTQEVLEFISKNCDGVSNKALAKIISDKFNIDVSDSCLKSLMADRGICRKIRAKQERVPIFSSEIKEYIQENTSRYKDAELSEKILELFGDLKRADQIKSFRKRNGITRGVDGHYPKGNIPHNKGVKGWKAPGSEKGWFKKGNTPINKLKIGTERINVDGYVEVKVMDPNVWEMKQRVIWKKCFGEITSNDIITFKDGNSLNCDADNLIKLSRQEHLEMVRNGYYQHTGMLKETCINISRVTNLARQKDKGGKVNDEGDSRGNNKNYRSRGSQRKIKDKN